MKKFVTSVTLLSIIALSISPLGVVAEVHVCPPGQSYFGGNTLVPAGCVADYTNLVPKLYEPQTTTADVPTGSTPQKSSATVPASTLNGGANYTGPSQKELTPVPITPINFSPEDLFGGSSSGDGAPTEAGNASGATEGCQNNNMGGALGGIGSQLLGALTNKLMGSLGNAGGPISSIIGSLINGGGSNINAAGLITQLTGGGQAGQMLNLLFSTGLGNKLNGFVDNLFRGGGLSNLFGGGVAGTVAGNASGLAGKAAEAIFGGGLGSGLGSGVIGGGAEALSSSLGGALGLAGGLGIGGEVPVSEAQLRSIDNKIQGNTDIIQSDQDTQLQVTCVGNVLVKKTRQQLTAKADQTDLNAFRKRGGKLIFYSGWMDPAVAARMVTAYYEDL